MDTDDSYYTPGHRNSEGCCLKCIRWLLIAMNVVIALAAVGGLVVGIIWRSTVESTLQQFCVQCKDVYMAYIIIFAIILAFSLVGFLALCTRNDCFRALYIFLMFIVFIAVLSISVTYLLVTRGIVDLEALWDAAVKRGDAMCGLELELQCSGWKSLCHTSVLGAFPLGPSNKTHGNGPKCPVCAPDDQAKIDLYNNTCKNVATDSLKQHSGVALPIGFTIAGLVLIIMIVTCLVRRKMKRHEPYG